MFRRLDSVSIFRLGSTDRAGPYLQTKYYYHHNQPTPTIKGEKVKLLLCLISYALRHEDMWGSGGTAPPFLTQALDGVVSFTPLPLSPWCLLDRRLDGLQSRSGRCREAKNLSPPGIEPGLSSLRYTGSSTTITITHNP
jgi:hypothetical protein